MNHTVDTTAKRLQIDGHDMNTKKTTVSYETAHIRTEKTDSQASVKGSSPASPTKARLVPYQGGGGLVPYQRYFGTEPTGRLAHGYLKYEKDPKAGKGIHFSIKEWKKTS